MPSHSTGSKIMPIVILAILFIFTGIWPFAVAQDRTFKVSGGNVHSLALQTFPENKVYACGENQNGQLGLGDLVDRNVMTELAGAFYGHDIVQIAAGGDHSLALTAGNLACSWGKNDNGQLGRSGIKSKPRLVRGLPPIIYIAAGNRHSLAVDLNGRVWAWGDNVHGQLGWRVGAGPYNPIPAKVPGLPATIEKVAAGDHHSLALTSDGRVFTWGSNVDGQLGIGTVGSIYKTPQEVTINLANRVIISLTAGGEHSIALEDNADMWTWGRNFNCQLGYETEIDPVTEGMMASAEPGLVEYFNEYGIDIGEIAGRGPTTIARDTNGLVWTFGLNWFGQLGWGMYGAGQQYTNPGNVLVTEPMGQLLENIVTVGAGHFHSLAVDDTGTVWSWGLNNSGQLGAGPGTPWFWPRALALEVP